MVMGTQPIHWLTSIEKSITRQYVARVKVQTPLLENNIKILMNEGDTF